MRELGLAVYGVSYDSPKSNASFADKHRLPFLLLSDRDRSLAKRVGASIPLLPFPKRVSYLVGAEGLVLKAYRKVKPETHADEVLRDVKELTRTA